MLKVILQDKYGFFEQEGYISQFTVNPDIIIWDKRAFKLSGKIDYLIYKEAFAVGLITINKGDALPLI